MAEYAMSIGSFLIILLLPIHCNATAKRPELSLPQTDADLIQFALNLEFLEAEFFLFGSMGYGLDQVAPNLTMGGPPPIGAKIANLGPLIKDIISQFAYQEVGHLRAIIGLVEGFPRPLMNLSSASFAKVMDKAIGRPLRPPFDPYANEVNFLLASYLIPYVGLTGYIGANPELKSVLSRKLVGGLLGVESGQDAVIRVQLYERATKKVEPYGIMVAEFTEKISNLRDRLGRGGKKDEGIVVPKREGAEGKISGNVLAGDEKSVSFPRIPEEILRIVYNTGNERVPGGFYPKGGNGRIARSYLTK